MLKTFKKYGFPIITGVLVVVLAVMAVTISGLTKTVSSQEGEIELLDAEIWILDEQLALMQKELEDYLEEMWDNGARMDALNSSGDSYAGDIGDLTVYSYDTLINRHMPDEAVRLLETMVRSFSTSDEELYKSLFKDGAFGPDGGGEYLMSFFERYKGAEYTIRQISSHIEDIETLQTGPYYAVVAAEAENGEYFRHPAVGITRDETTGKWIIYDFD